MRPGEARWERRSQEPWPGRAGVPAPERNDLAELLGKRVMAQRLSLLHTRPIIANGFGLVIEIESKHLFGLLREFHFLWRRRRHSPEIVDLVGENECMLQLLGGMQFQFGRDLHPFGSPQNIAINDVGNDRLILTGEIFIQHLDKILDRLIVLLLVVLLGHDPLPFDRAVFRCHCVRCRKDPVRFWIAKGLSLRRDRPNCASLDCITSLGGGD
jgi:hypothetical protein